LADHGDGCGAHQWNQKMVLYEEAIRVPMILAGPHQRQAGVNGPGPVPDLLQGGGHTGSRKPFRPEPAVSP